jgi:hypothetical protein
MLRAPIRRYSALVFITAILACRYQGTPVQLQGGQADISALAGRWDGEYSSPQSGRAGGITFTIKAGTDSAFGDVVMTPTAGQPVSAADVESRAHFAHATQAQVLTVTFVRVSGGLVAGSLEPYVAPDCKCVVSTEFRGAVQGNTIKGEYVTRGLNGLRQTGSWSVQRAAR